MLDTSRLPDFLRETLLEQRALPDNDFGHKRLSLLTANEALDLYLTHHGIIGYTEQILRVYTILQSAETKRG